MPVDRSADFVQVEPAAEDGMPPRDVVLAFEMAVERLARNAGVFADFRDGHAVERLIHRMQNLHFHAYFR